MLDLSVMHQNTDNASFTVIFSQLLLITSFIAHTISTANIGMYG